MGRRLLPKDMKKERAEEKRQWENQERRRKSSHKRKISCTSYGRVREIGRLEKTRYLTVQIPGAVGLTLPLSCFVTPNSDAE